MQIPFLHQQIILETERLRDMHRSMMMHNSAIPTAEMESFLQQLRKIYSSALQLGNENSLQLLNEIHLANAQHFAATEIANQETKKIEIPVEKNIASVETPKTVQPEKIPAASQPMVERISQIVNGQKPGEQYAPKTHNSVNSNTETVAKKFAEKETLADKMAHAEPGKRISDNMKMPVKDINAAIGINEKFQFINQLFHGDSQKYTQFVNELNNCPTAEAAKKSIQQIADANHWSELPVAKQFMDVVERKFA